MVCVFFVACTSIMEGWVWWRVGGFNLERGERDGKGSLLIYYNNMDEYEHNIYHKKIDSITTIVNG